jgi:hypothetical protein
MKKLSGFLLLVLSIFFVSSAHASYVCQVAYWPSQGSLGDSGYLRIVFSSESSCPSANRSTYYLCSENSTDPQCASSTRYEYNLTVLLAHLEALQSAAQNSNSVLLHVSGCEGNVGSCLINVNYLR